MNVLSLCGIALICYAALLIIGKEKNGIGALLALTGTICLLLPAVASLKTPLDQIFSLLPTYGFTGEKELLKAFGIGFCCEFTADICKEAGFQGLADALSFSCKVAILCLCIPLWAEVFSLIGGLLP